MSTNLRSILVSGAPILLLGWISVLMLRFAWRSWTDPQVTVEQFLMAWQIKLARAQLGDERYRSWQARMQRRSSRRLFAAIVAFFGVYLLGVAIRMLYVRLQS